ncbi:rhamnulokinase [Paenibacillus herberti]|uniref:Rhamnulokinase n=1 Tax=Paenibacillus herberti TaxID=1619309 RepID=A0A229NUP1_9BACL|nr:rhamnulokinase family protein [Paenibacillus herberti]OXM13588.1 rhamnulokinase [Paenibacillus herberti]
MTTRLAFDLGAGSGRAVLGRLGSRRIELQEVHRFPNQPVQAGPRLHWDILRLLHELKQGLLQAKRHAGQEPASMAIDSWAVDFGLLGADGELLGNPVHYRDRRTDGVMERLRERHGDEWLFSRSGLQFLPFNTIYQLAAMSEQGSPQLKQAQTLLMIPDLLRYFLTGVKRQEFTNATTTGLLNPQTRSWDNELLKAAGVPVRLFAPLAQPGAAAGELTEALRGELGLGPIEVLCAAEHDTASAVAAVPALEDNFAYLSCGTWSLMGTEVPEPVLSAEALRYNFTNEGGVEGSWRLLKNIMGLWILEETRREWEREGHCPGYAELLQEVQALPAGGPLIDPDDSRFLHAGAMTPRIREWCRETGQPEPRGYGGYARCILESLALQYRYIFEQTEQASGRRFSGLHMVGGGIQNRLLCQWTADSLGLPVWAGPAEGSAIGNLAVQWIAAGELSGVREARRVIRDSFDVEQYEPSGGTGTSAMAAEAYGRFLALKEKMAAR